jgi:hypothetical protein
MKSINKIVSCIFLIFLTVSSSFASTIVFGQKVQATCEAIAKEEAEKWPSVAYCSEPLIVENKNGGVQNLPNDKDAWTELEQYKNCWSAMEGQFTTDKPGNSIGSKSFYGESYLIEGLRFDFLCANYVTRGSLDPLYISIYDKIHFWFKGLESSNHFNVIFDADNVAPYEMVCDLGKYSKTDG